MQTFEQKMSELQTTLERMKKEMANTIQNEFSSAAKEVFAGFPSILGIMWTQYTPYFNDGDVCEFSADKENFVILTNDNLQEYKDGGLSFYDYGDEEDGDDQPRFHVLSLNGYDGTSDTFTDPKAYFHRPMTDEEWEKEISRHTVVPAYVKRENYLTTYQEPKTYTLTEKTKFRFMMTNLLRNIPDDCLLDVFGDHCCVTLWADGRSEVSDFPDHG